ncbi:hypothetical protein PT286_07435 [Neisseriaceae bacterium ESL0693]|nr:hypothetical protein [Neisseriaceae bacterium ESL0693]
MAGLEDWHKETSRHKASLPLSAMESCINDRAAGNKNITVEADKWQG